MFGPTYVIIFTVAITFFFYVFRKILPAVSRNYISYVCEG